MQFYYNKHAVKTKAKAATKSINSKLALAKSARGDNSLPSGRGDNLLPCLTVEIQQYLLPIDNIESKQTVNFKIFCNNVRKIFYCKNKGPDY